MEGLEKALKAADDLLFERLGDDARYVRWVLPVVVVETTIATLRFELADDTPSDVRERLQARLPGVAEEATELVRGQIEEYEAPTEQLRLTPDILGIADKSDPDRDG